MYNGFLELGGVELLNAPRVQSYVRRFMPQVQLKGCHTCNYFRYALLSGALGDVPYPGSIYPGATYPNGTLSNPDDSYLDPATDFAPWYQPERPASEDFLGFFPIDVQGMDNSTHTVTPIELVGDGANIPPGRHRSREIRVRAMAISLTDEGLEEGLTWLRGALDSTSNCAGQGIECAGQQMRFFTYCPGHDDISQVSARAQDAARLMYRVEALEGPLVEPRASGVGSMALIEFTLVAGVPWWFTYTTEVGKVTGNTSNQVPHVDLPPLLDTYDDLIIDPTYGNLSKPPRPPLMEPAGVTPPSNWYHYTFETTPEYTQRWGRGMIRLRVTSGSSARRMIRVRFYSNPDGRSETELRGRGWDGEFLISYLPANSELILDSALETAVIGLLDGSGKTSPAGHLVHGSDGRPFQWPALLCDTPYTIQIDSQVQLGNATVAFELATRE